MQIERFKVYESCAKCGGVSLLFRLDRAISKDFLPFLVSNGFTEAQHFTKAGILYVESDVLIVNGPFGKTELQVKCKRKVDCQEIVNNFENLLQTM